MVTPTGYTALDLIGFTDKGPYSSLENYVKNDLAHYAGSIWRCKIDDTTNVTPAENANWTVFVSEPSNLVEASIAPIETSPATAAHAQGSQLFYNDTLYKAKTAIAIGDSLVVNTNIEAAPKVTTQLEAKANTADLGTAAGKDSTDAVTQNNTDLVESGAVYTAVSAVGTRVDNVEENIAPLENDAIASQAYAIGEQFMKGDVLYKAKTAIAQGDTFTLNTNYEAADNITDQLGSVNEALTNEVETRAKVSAHNFIPFDLERIKRKNTGGTWSGNTFTPTNTPDLHFAVGSDGTVTVSGSTPSDKPGSLVFVDSLGMTLDTTETYILNGCPSGGELYAQIYDNNDSWFKNYKDTGSSIQFQPEYSHIQVVLQITANQTISGSLVFKPMIRLASDPSSEFTPYAMTNRELTENLTINDSSVQSVDISSYTTNNNQYTCPADGYIVVDIPAGTGYIKANLLNWNATDNWFQNSSMSHYGCVYCKKGTRVFFDPHLSAGTFVAYFKYANG